MAQTQGEPLAVIWFSFKLPGGVQDESSLWDLLSSGRNVMSDWPSSRLNVDGFLDEGRRRPNTLYSRGGHFIEADPAAFDAPFFSITAKEAAAMDPAQRLVLETAFHSFENAGIPLDRLKGSQTAVLAPMSTDDYSRSTSKDVDQAPRMAATGIPPSMLPNRVSWFFNLQGPSALVDTACSSGMVAIDMACQYIRNGFASTALVLGANLLLGPECSVMLGNMGFLSPNSVCYSFDHRANGYARGEGVVGLVIKALPLAIQDGDMIRGIIRSSVTNQDGRTPGLTQPSSESQERMIRLVYKQAGLDYKATRYVEAHGTGTPIGDPIEMKAIGRVFRTSRTADQPLYVGSIKSSIGHLEGTSGLAGVLKTIMALEKGIIPLNALFEKINPALDVDFYHTEIPTTPTAWPNVGIRRASVNSFGFGGTNSHLILDDAFHYLQGEGLVGNHNCTISMGSDSGNEVQEGKSYETNGDSPTLTRSRLLVWSAADEGALKRMIRDYSSYYQSRVFNSQSTLDRLALTLASRRSHMSWRTCAVIGPAFHLGESATLPTTKATRFSSEKALSFVFTGQGAQHVKMGLGLLQYHEFKEALLEAGKKYESLGRKWSIMGHSSGEIAAAYTIGALTQESACKVAYYRGQVAAQLKATCGTSSPGAMMSINAPESRIQHILGSTASIQKGSAHIACVNSPLNCTVSGDAFSLEALKEHLDAAAIPNQKLKTGVTYHAPIMRTVAAQYLELLGVLEPQKPNMAITMISSVTGRAVATTDLSTGQYWVDNLIMPVKFSEAVCTMIQEGSIMGVVGEERITDVFEIGPHCALRQPLKDTLRLSHNKHVRYCSVLDRTMPSCQSFLELLGNLFCNGYGVSVSTGNQQAAQGAATTSFLTDCPRYPFDTSRKYWKESRLSRDNRLRQAVPNEVLGVRSHDWNPLAPRWRNFWSVETMPWVGDHIINNMVLVPGTAMLAMAIEAMAQMASADRPVAGFYVKGAEFMSAISVQEDLATETVLHLIPLQQSYEKESVWSRITIFAYNSGRWSKCFQATVQIQYADGQTEVDAGAERRLSEYTTLQRYSQAIEECRSPFDPKALYDVFKQSGINYGKSFQLLQDIRSNGRGTVVARVDLQKAGNIGSLVHPAVLDAAIHLTLVPASKGIAEPWSTSVPRKLHDMWVSAEAWTSTSAVRITTTANAASAGSGTTITTCLLPDDRSTPLCVIGSVYLVPVAQLASSKHNRTRLLYGIDWRPQLSLLDSKQLSQLCDADNIPADSTGMAQFYSRLEETLDILVRGTLQQISQTHLQRAPEHMSQLIAWMERHIAQGQETPPSIDNTSIEQARETLHQLATERPKWKIYDAVGSNILSIIAGEIDPLQLLLSTGLAETFYSEIFERNCDFRLRNFLRLASHENPNLRILEVGAGTGGMTKHVLSAFQELEELSGGDKFADYTYTDISPAFFENARDKYDNTFPGRFQLKTFDIENEASKEGFQPGSYDMIIAGSVLHATRDLNATLGNLRTVLKPGGSLVFLEVLAPYSIAANLGFGVLPGWWLSVEAWRSDGPTITEGKWDQVLKGAGFSGNELVLRDYESDVCHLSGIVVSRAISPENTEHEEVVAQGSALFLVIDDQSEYQCALAENVRIEASRSARFQEIEVLTLGSIRSNTVAASDVTISLLEVGAPFLATLSEEKYGAMKEMMACVRNLLWVTAIPQKDDGDLPDRAQYNLTTGFIRSIRSEALDRHFVHLVNESDEQDVSAFAGHIANILRLSFESDPGAPELEYVLRGDVMHTGRLYEAKHLNEQVDGLISPQLRSGPWKPGPPLKLSIHARGMLDSLEFVEDDTHQTAIGPHEIEIEAKAWGLSSRDVFVALGRLDGQEFGYDCAGVVTRVGSDADFRPGDRVVMNGAGCIRTYPRTSSQAAIAIPDSLSFAAAASMISPGITAYHSLVNVARLQKGEKILIHSAAGSTGQMAIWAAKMIGAEIFATVGFDAKKQLLVDQFGLAPDHVFYSRDVSFARGVMRVTNGYGVDVVLNSLSGDGLRASWECVAPFGRFIELGKADIVGESSLPMSNFARNVTFSAVDLHHLGLSDTALACRLMREVTDLAIQGHVQHPEPLHLFPLSDVEQAFRFMQSGTNTGRIVIEATDSAVVQKRLLDRCDWKCDSNSSYVVAGGLGGIGRAILEWLADKGARYLIVPSRSGGVGSAAASRVVSALEKRGVVVATPACDVASAASLKSTLEECSQRLPPIRGCINAAMVLQDAVFENMTYAQWDLTLRSKAHTTWNLHELLPPSLDFFVLLSSLAGVYGSPAQSNYAAGCAFQDAVASYRTRRGQKAISLDVGWMRTIGIIAETEQYQRHRKNTADMGQIEAEELMALLNIYCDPSLPWLAPEKSQLLIGVVTPRDLLAQGQPVTPLAQRPLFAGFSRATNGSAQGSGNEASVDLGALFRQATDPKEQGRIVVAALTAKLARALSVSPEDVDSSKRLSDCGVDSLVAVELRNWIGIDFRAEVAVFEIMGGVTIEAVGALVADRSELAGDVTSKE
ncbi:Uu.00g123390.m01.CDS01 [Anthostomella pinea]|uniref:Uu.00g123390.m01.CDS01 n=1 Tax=Anthostomella pinea TaxID=933095 RepID=A0AAI8VIC3_9PEZI|nr:Uu.00g123390.m01.CDS01 [Anthostomella pinea]